MNAMTAAAYETAFGMLYLLTGEGTEPGNYEATTGWAVVKVTFVDDDPVVAGTDDLSMLFEELLGADPTGQEGADFLS